MKNKSTTKKSNMKNNTTTKYEAPEGSMEKSVADFAKSNSNPTFEEFERFVDSTRKEVRKAVDYRKSVNDDDPVSISKYTDEAIKKMLRSSRWA